MIGVILTGVFMVASLAWNIGDAKNYDEYDYIIGRYAQRQHAPCQVVVDEVSKAMLEDGIKHVIVMGQNQAATEGHMWVEVTDSNGVKKTYDARYADPRSRWQVKSEETRGTNVLAAHVAKAPKYKGII